MVHGRVHRHLARRAPVRGGWPRPPGSTGAADILGTILTGTAVSAPVPARSLLLVSPARSARSSDSPPAATRSALPGDAPIPTTDPRPTMNILRFSRPHRCRAAVAGRRVFIRADLNVPLRRCRCHHRRHPHPRLHPLHPRWHSTAGAAVMVTSPPRPSDGGPVHPRRLALPRWRRGSVNCRAVMCRSMAELGGWRGRWRPGHVVLLENCRVNKGEKKNDEALSRKMAALDRHLRARRLRHRPPRRGQHLRHRAVRADRLRRPAAVGRDRRDRQGPGRAEAPAGGDRRRLQGLDQADHPRGAGRQGRPADRGRRHRQHLHPRRGRPDRPQPGRARPARHRPARSSRR